jgi:hypothetical protein
MHKWFRRPKKTTQCHIYQLSIIGCLTNGCKLITNMSDPYEVARNCVRTGHFNSLALVFQNQLSACIPALVQAHQSIIHIFSCPLFRNVRNQGILHRIQQYLLSLHFPLLMSCQFMRITGIGTTPSIYSLRSFSSKRRRILAFQPWKFVAPSKLSLILRVVTIVTCPEQKQKSATTNLLYHQYAVACVSRR